MREIIAFIFCCCTYAAISQKDIRPFLSISFAPSAFYNDLGFHEIEVGGGVRFKDQQSLQLSLRGAQPANSQLNFVTISLASSYRILKQKHIVSPAFGLDFGTELWSNGKDKIVSEYQFTSYEPAPKYNWVYKRGVFFEKVKLLADIRIKSFNILLGPTYNIYFFKTTRVVKWWYSPEYEEHGNNINVEMGIGFETTVQYTFPMKKRTEKAVSDI